MIKHILVSQPEPTSPKSPYFEISRKHGVDLEFHSFIKVEGISPLEFRAQKIKILDHTAIVFTSRHAIDHFFTLCQQLRVKIPDTMKYFGISETVSLYIQKYIPYRKRKVFFGTTGKWPDLVQVMAKHKAEKYLVPQSDVHNGDIAAMLDAKKLEHTDCVMYRSVSCDEMPKSLRAYDMIILFTPSGVESLLKHYPNFKQGKLRIACWGQNTAQAIRNAGLRLDLEAHSGQSLSITGALDLYLEQENKETAPKKAAKKPAAKKPAATKAATATKVKVPTTAKKTATAPAKPAATKKATSTKTHTKAKAS